MENATVALKEKMSQTHFVTLLSPNLLSHWRALRVENMRSTVLRHYLPDTVVAQCCEEKNNGAALAQLRRHLIVSDDEQFYQAILTYAEQKRDALARVVETMWRDMEEEQDEDEEATTTTSMKAELTSSQYQLLLDHWTVIPLLGSALDMNTLEAILLRYLPSEEVQQLCQQLEHSQAVGMLHRRLLVINKASFFRQFVKHCKTQQEHFAACANFMRNGDATPPETGGDAEWDISEPMWQRQQVVEDGDLFLIRSQLAEMRLALVHTMSFVTNRMREIMLRSAGDTANWTEPERENVTAALQLRNKEWENDLQEMMNQCDAKITLLEDCWPKMKIKLKDTRKRLQQAERERQENHQECQRNVERLQANLLERIHQMQSQINQLQESTPTPDPNVPFNLPHSESTLLALKSNECFGLTPILCDSFGRYEKIDWNHLIGNHNWNAEWTEVKNGKRHRGLYFPALTLPREYGDCILCLWLGWENQQLELQGRIPTNLSNRMIWPKVIAVDLQITLLMMQDQILFKKRKLLKFLQSDWSTLHIVCNAVDRDWDKPTALVKVFPFQD